MASVLSDLVMREPLLPDGALPLDSCSPSLAFLFCSSCNACQEQFSGLSRPGMIGVSGAAIGFLWDVVLLSCAVSLCSTSPNLLWPGHACLEVFVAVVIVPQLAESS